MPEPRPTPYRERIDRALGSRDPIAIIETTPAEVQRIVESTSTTTLHARPFEGKWTPCEVVGHLVDAELIFSVRLRLLLAEDEPALPNWRQDDWVARLRYRDADPTVLASQFTMLRRMNVPLWKSLSRENLSRGGTHTSRGRETLAGMLRSTAGHDLLHLEQLNRYITAAMRQQLRHR